jgi:trehalose-6-phosphate synthase
MNLIAQEFVAARRDGDGVLVSSKVTGAAHDLTDALIINPYDGVLEGLEEVARAPLTLRGFPERHDAMARVKHPGSGRVAADAVS